MRLIGLRWWLLLSVTVWGIAGVWMAHVETAGEFYAARFLLGTAEAGFAPGVTFVISQWIPIHARARAMAIALSSVPLSLVLGGPLCGWMLGLDSPLGMAEWRGMFLLQAIPNFVLAVAAFFYFVDRPADARWLSDSERQKLTHLLTSEQTEDAPAPLRWTDVARDPQVWRCAATWFLVMTGSYALVFWLPQLVRQLALADSEFLIGTLSALPQAALVDRAARERAAFRPHRRAPMARSGPAQRLQGSLCLPLRCCRWDGRFSRCSWWPVPGSAPRKECSGRFPLRSGSAEAACPWASIAFISMFGTAGGIVGPVLIGWVRENFGSFMPAIAALAALLILACFVIVMPSRWRRAEPVRGA